ncbi:MAG: CHAT domain-containing protein [Pyrinomonadaceae bacterium]
MTRAAIFRVASTFVLCFAATASLQAQQTILTVGNGVEKQIKEKETQSFYIDLKAGETAVVEVVQKGADIQAEAYEPDAKDAFVDFDIPNGFYDTDRHRLTAAKDGRYRLDTWISTSEKDTAGYAIKLIEIRPTTAEDKAINDAATKIFALYEEGLKLRKEGAAAKQAALAKFEAIIPLSRVKQDKYWESLAYEYLASGLRSLGDSRKALTQYAESLKIAESLGFKSKQGFLINQIGLTYYNLSDLKGSTENFEKAFAIARETHDRTLEAGATNNLGLVADWVGDSEKAIGYYSKARDIYRELGDHYTETTVIGNIGLVYANSSQPAKAREYYEQALEYYKKTNDQDGIAWVYFNMGTAFHTSGDVRTALGLYEKALVVREAEGNKKAVALITGTIAGAYDRLGEIDKALELYERSIAMDREIKSGAEGSSLNNLGLLYHTLGDDEKGLKYYEESLKLRRANSERRREGAVLGNIGSLFEAKGELEKAATYYRDSLKIAEELKDKTSKATTLGRLASIERKKGDLKAASDLLGQALALNREVENRRDEASNLASLGQIADQNGDKAAALDRFASSAEIWHRLEDKNQEALLLYRKARALRDLKRADEAKRSVEAAIALVEKFRGTIPDQRLRASYFASVQQYYQLLIELTLSEKNQSSISAAYEISERSRARVLIELLQQARVEIADKIDPTLVAEERRLTELVTGRSRQLSQMLAGKYSEDRAKELKQEILGIDDQLTAVKQKIHGQNRRYADLVSPENFTVSKTQSLIGSDTVLLEYKLGDEQSFLWIVTNKDVSVVELGPRAEIDTKAKELYDGLVANSTNNEPKIDALKQDVSKKILGPASTAIKGKKLVVVADGILQFLPFALLAENAGPKEIVSLPSASVLSELRSKTDNVKPAAKTLAVFADAVFAKDDVRLKAANVTFETTPTSTRRLLRDVNLTEGLPRLLSSRVEARNIAAFVQDGKAEVNVDFEANRDNVIGHDLTQYRIVHFATHGLLDTTNPEFSGLVLSLYGSDGKPKDGVMRLGQIYNLKLNSDLVVLSACQTALGKDIRGEGLIGLTRGFMFAGARRVVSSLWKVDDAATAEFMKVFYRNMLQNKMPPATALRSAQSELRKIPRYRSPYYWAGFIIQGEL